MSANIGGLATLNWRSYTTYYRVEGGLTFNFLTNTMPVSVLSMVAPLTTVYFMYAKNMVVSNELKATIMELDASRTLKDVSLLKKL